MGPYPVLLLEKRENRPHVSEPAGNETSQVVIE